MNKEATRVGFGKGLLKAAEKDKQVVGITADLTDSTQMNKFAEKFPERFFDVGVAEQNLVTVASGMAAIGKKPFAAAFAAFSPGRCWEQIRTTICLNDQPVKVIGSHAGISVGPDGATHQMLEDIALMRSLPNMIVLAPGDALEAEKATQKLAEIDKPAYMRLSREKTTIFTKEQDSFEIGKAYTLREGKDITLLSTGIMTDNVLKAQQLLADQGIHAEVVHVPTIKPLDENTILKSVKKTNKVVTVEEAQIAGGFGSAISELLSEKYPVLVHRIGIKDKFGSSGSSEELFKEFKLTAEDIVETVKTII